MGLDSAVFVEQIQVALAFDQKNCPARQQGKQGKRQKTPQKQGEHGFLARYAVEWLFHTTPWWQKDYAGWLYQ